MLLPASARHLVTDLWHNDPGIREAGERVKGGFAPDGDRQTLGRLETKRKELLARRDAAKWESNRRKSDKTSSSLGRLRHFRSKTKILSP